MEFTFKVIQGKEYILISEKGKKTRKYRYTGIPTEIETAIEHYKNPKQNYTELKNKIRQKYYEIQGNIHKTENKIRRRGEVNKYLKHKIVQVEIPNIMRLTQSQLQKYKRKLLEQIVTDKDIINLLIQPENFQKLQHRLEYQLIGYDRDNKVTIEFKKFNTTPEKVNREIREIFTTDNDYPERDLKMLKYIINKIYNSRETRKVMAIMIMRKN